MVGRSGRRPGRRMDRIPPQHAEHPCDSHRTGSHAPSRHRRGRPRSRTESRAAHLGLRRRFQPCGDRILTSLAAPARRISRRLQRHGNPAHPAARILPPQATRPAAQLADVPAPGHALVQSAALVRLRPDACRPRVRLRCPRAIHRCHRPPRGIRRRTAQAAMRSPLAGTQPRLRRHLRKGFRNQGPHPRNFRPSAGAFRLAGLRRAGARSSRC